jgi:hypothetical protein
MVRLRADLQRHRLCQHEDADICDLLPDFDRLRISVVQRFAEKDRPEIAVEHQRMGGPLAGRIGVCDGILQFVGAINRACASISRADEVLFATRV